MGNWHFCNKSIQLYIICWFHVDWIGNIQYTIWINSYRPNNHDFVSDVKVVRKHFTVWTGHMKMKNLGGLKIFRYILEFLLNPKFIARVTYIMYEASPDCPYSLWCFIDLTVTLDMLCWGWSKMLKLCVMWSVLTVPCGDV